LNIILNETKYDKYCIYVNYEFFVIDLFLHIKVILDMDPIAIKIINSIMPTVPKSNFGMTFIEIPVRENNANSIDRILKFCFDQNNICISYIDMLMSNNGLKIVFGECGIVYEYFVTLPVRLYKELIDVNLHPSNIKLFNVIVDRVISIHVDEIVYVRNLTIILYAIKLATGTEKILAGSEIEYEDDMSDDNESFTITLNSERAPDHELVVEISMDKDFYVHDPKYGKIICPNTGNKVRDIRNILASGNNSGSGPKLISILAELLSYYVNCCSTEVRRV